MGSLDGTLLQDTIAVAIGDALGNDQVGRPLSLVRWLISTESKVGLSSSHSVEDLLLLQVPFLHLLHLLFRGEVLLVAFLGCGLWHLVHGSLRKVRFPQVFDHVCLHLVYLLLFSTHVILHEIFPLSGIRIKGIILAQLPVCLGQIFLYNLLLGIPLLLTSLLVLHAPLEALPSIPPIAETEMGRPDLLCLIHPCLLGHVLSILDGGLEGLLLVVRESFSTEY